MADVTVSADPSYGPPRNVIVAHATGGSILKSCEVTRIVGGVEEPIRRQPIVGVSDVTLYDYEAPYDRSAVYRIQGLERNTLASSWTGNKNASTSQLSQDGSVVATNLVLNPSFETGDATNYYFAGNWVKPAKVQTFEPQSGNYEMTVYQSATGLNAVTSALGSIPTGQVVAVARINSDGTLSTGTLPTLGVQVDGVTINNGITVTPYAWQDVVSIVTIPDNAKNVTWRFACFNPNGTYIRFDNIGLFSLADWQAMQSLGITWFDGDSFQAGTTTQYDESSSPVTLSPDTGWLIHPGNPAKSMRLPLGHITGMGDTTRRSNATRHDILGARYPIYTNPGPRYSRELSMKLRTRTADDENMLDALLDDQTPILFNPRGVDASRLNLNPMYLQVGDVTAARYAQSLYPTSDSPQHWRDWTLPCTQVDSPAVSQQAVGWTYAQLLNDNTRYQSVIISYKDYASLQAHSVKDGQ